MVKSVKKLIQNLFKSDTVRNSSTLVFGTLLAQLIPILLQPVLRRMYSPEEYGLYSVYLSLLGILVIASSLRLEQAIVLPKKEGDAVNLFFLSIFISFGFNFLLFWVVYFFNHQLLSLFNVGNRFSIFLYLLPLGNFIFSFYQSMNIWLIRKRGFKAVALNKVVRRTFEVSGQIGSRFSFAGMGLLFGDLLGHASNSVAASYQGIKLGLTFRLFNFQRMKKMLKEYADFPKFNSITALMGAISTLLPTILINKYYSSEFAGYYDLSKLVLSIPFALVATSLSNVLLQNISAKFREKQSIRNDIYKVFLFTIIIAVLEIFVIHFFGVYLFKIVFGKEWGIAGEISTILVWSYSINFIIATFSFLFIALNKIKLYSLWQLIYFIVILSTFFFTKLPFNEFLRKYVLLVIFVFFINIVMSIYIVRVYEKKLVVNNI